MKSKTVERLLASLSEKTKKRADLWGIALVVLGKRKRRFKSYL